MKGGVKDPENERVGALPDFGRCTLCFEIRVCQIFEESTFPLSKARLIAAEVDICLDEIGFERHDCGTSGVGEGSRDDVTSNFHCRKLQTILTF
ncbi:hypothetical protein CDAR_4781 [Caerostris darwini]|uniref:Uncharacterized protein n=1 Tax=Caerostris darwini TaxID=1538125 RepID=A0AAV4P3F7_9ARAC|nr:hypothetical protein CDAR_4781 [Caerostris darwini]